MRCIISKRLLVLGFACNLLIVGGCRRNPAGQNAPALRNSTNMASGTPVKVLYDGFEGEALADFWLPGNYGSGLYVPGAIKLSTNYARSGRSAQITVREGDVAAPGDAGTTVERAELDSGHFNLLGQEVWYGFSMLLPTNFPIVDERLVSRRANNPMSAGR